MKVYIGPYSHWFQPYRWVKKIIQRKYSSDRGRRLEEYEKTSKIAQRWFGWLRALEDWVDSFYTRKVKVRIDYYDTWSMDNTLALIVLPMLKQLRDAKPGSPAVDDDDVPEELKSSSADPLTEEQKNAGYTDNNWHKRWEWVLNEMIWAFEQINDENAENQFHSDLDPAEPRDDPGIEFEEAMRRGKFDKDGYIAWQNRKTRGLTLFGKYYEGLWD